MVVINQLSYGTCRDCPAPGSCQDPQGAVPSNNPRRLMGLGDRARAMWSRVSVMANLSSSVGK